MFDRHTDIFRTKNDISDIRRSERPIQTTRWSPLEPPGYASRRKEQRRQIELAEQERLRALEERERLHALEESKGEQRRRIELAEQERLCALEEQERLRALEERERLHALEGQGWRRIYQGAASTSQDRTQITDYQASGQIDRRPDGKAMFQLLGSTPERKEERKDLRQERRQKEVMSRAERDNDSYVSISKGERNRITKEQKKILLEEVRSRRVEKQERINSNPDYYKEKEFSISEAIIAIANERFNKAITSDGGLKHLYDNDKEFKQLVKKMAEEWRRDPDNWVSASYGKENIAAAFMALWIMYNEVRISPKKEELRAIIKEQRSIVQGNAAASLGQVMYNDPAQPSGSGQYYTTTRGHRVSFQESEAHS